MAESWEITRRRFLGQAALAVGGAVLAAPLSRVALAAPAALPRPELRSFKFGFDLPNYLGQVAHWVALEKGYFREAGFDQIEVINSSEVLAGVVGSSLLLATGDTDIIFLSVSKGVKIAYLATNQEREYRMFMVGPGISGAADLKGKTVNGGAGGPDARPAFNTRVILRKLGLDPERDVQWVWVGLDAGLQAVVSGRIAGSLAQPRHEFPLYAAGGKFLYRELLDSPQSGIFGTVDAVRKYPNTITAYLSATIRARQYIAKDVAATSNTRDEVFAILDKNGIRVAEALRSAHQASMLIVSPDAGFRMEAMERLVKDSQDIGAIPKQFDWHQAVDVSLLRKAQEAAGVPVRPRA
ncbi:MAG TPA: ABC transporter substrate-binding protein [Anaerolineales bacterium]|nr:ABC transporter substrate-binding protein [Anaerolineales bacterium]